MSAELYNAMLESWRGTYRWWREHNPKPPEPAEGPKFPTEWQQPLKSLDSQFTQIRKDRPEWGRVHSRVGRGVIRRFDRTRTAFYERCQTGRKPGYPRFKAAARWRTIEIPDAYAAMLVPPGGRGNGSAKWWRLQVGGLPRIRFEDRDDRVRTALAEGTLVELRVVRTALRVELHVVVKLPALPAPTGEPERPVGIDKGLKVRLALCDGTLVAPREPDRQVIKRRQRALSRSKKGSRTRAKKRAALAKAWTRETERARQADHRLARQLVGSYDAIAVEQLNVAGMLRSKRFSRKLSDQRWVTLDQILEHKAAKAGIQYTRVNPAYTSTDCSACGHRQPMPPRVRVYHCGNCGLRLDRDVNASINICARAYCEARGREGHPPTRCAHKLPSEDATHPPGGQRKRTSQNSTPDPTNTPVKSSL